VARPQRDSIFTRPPARRLSLVPGVLAAAESQVRTGLGAGGSGFEPSVPLLRKAHLGVANRRRRHERRSRLQVQVRNGNACLEWLPTAFPFAEGPRVRIRLPPAASLLRTAGEGARPELGQATRSRNSTTARRIARNRPTPSSLGPGWRSAGCRCRMRCRAASGSRPARTRPRTLCVPAGR
jgi:hypothetical protein